MGIIWFFFNVILFNVIFMEFCNIFYIWVNLFGFNDRNNREFFCKCNYDYGNNDI